MKRGFPPFWPSIAVLVAIVMIGCARPGSAPGGGPTTGPTSTPSVAIPALTPTLHLATCVDPSASPPPLAAPSAVPTIGRSEPQLSGSLSEQDREELFRRNYEANKAYRNRRPLPPQVIAANLPCVERVRVSLGQLRAQHRYDAASIEQALTTAGLTAVVARPAGRLDLAGTGGLLFAGETGQGCVFGEHGAASTTVGFGSGIADGGCLPAPD